MMTSKAYGFVFHNQRLSNMMRVNAQLTRRLQSAAMFDIIVLMAFVRMPIF